MLFFALLLLVSAVLGNLQQPQEQVGVTTITSVVYVNHCGPSLQPQNSVVTETQTVFVNDCGATAQNGQVSQTSAANAITASSAAPSSATGVGAGPVVPHAVESTTGASSSSSVASPPPVPSAAGTITNNLILPKDVRLLSKGSPATDMKVGPTTFTAPPVSETGVASAVEFTLWALRTGGMYKSSCKMTRVGTGAQTGSDSFEFKSSEMPSGQTGQGAKGQMEINCGTALLDPDLAPKSQTATSATTTTTTAPVVVVNNLILPKDVKLQYAGASATDIKVGPTTLPANRVEVSGDLGYISFTLWALRADGTWKSSCKLLRVGKGIQTESESYEFKTSEMPSGKGAKGQSEIKCDTAVLDPDPAARSQTATSAAIATSSAAVVISNTLVLGKDVRLRHGGASEGDMNVGPKSILMATVNEGGGTAEFKFELWTFRYEGMYKSNCKLSRLGKGPQTESETFELAATSMPIPNVKGSKGQSQIECDKEDFDLGYAPLINMDVPDLFKISFTEPRMFFGNAQQRAPPDKPDTVVTFSGLIAKGSDGAKKYAPRELIKYNIQYQAKDEGDFKGGIYTYNCEIGTIDGKSQSGKIDILNTGYENSIRNQPDNSRIDMKIDPGNNVRVECKCSKTDCGPD